MGYLGIVNIDGTSHKVGSTLFGTCATEAATAAKVVTCSDFTELPTGVTIHVKFTYSNTAANPTLNINSKGAKPIYRYGTTTPGTSAETSWNAGAVISFTYDGSSFMMNDWVNTNTNTDTNVTQTATNTNANYEVLFSGTADNTTRTEGARKYSNLTFNPSTGTLTTTKVVSANATLGVADIDTANITEDNVGNLIVTGAARFLNTINGSISGNAATASDAAKLNGYASDTAASNNTIARRTANGYIFATYFNQSSGAETPTSSSYIIYANSDGYFRKSTVANMKTAMSLNNVENKSSATIRGELTSSNVTTALGFTPATSDHTHTTSIATSTATNQITLAYGTKYAITAGGTSYVFTMPASDNTNTTYTIGTNGNNVTLTPSSGSVQSITVPYATSAGSASPTAGSAYYVQNLTGASRATTTGKSWVSMMNSSSTGSPVLPTAGKWWHVLSLDCWNSAPNNWVSQLAIATQDTAGVWYRKNPSSGTSIDEAAWNRLAEGDASGNAVNANKATSASYLSAFRATIASADDLNALKGDGIKYANVQANIVSNYGDGLVVAIPWSGNANYAHQLYFDDSSYVCGHRSLNNGTWSDWKRFIDESNYTDYTVKKDGTGASGTWGISITGNAATATKLQTARTISLGNDFQGSANFDGSDNITISASYYNVGMSSGNKSNYPWHRFLSTSNRSGQWTDVDAIIDIRRTYNGGPYGRLKISLRTNGTGTAVSASARWIYRVGFSVSDVKIAYWGVTGNAVYCDVFCNCGAYARTTVYQIQGSRVWTLVESREVNDTTTTDKKTSYEVYSTIESAGTELHSQAYTEILTAVDVGHVNSANMLNTNAGSSTNPVYFTDGVPTACTYSLNKTVPSDAKFTDTTYSLSASGESVILTGSDGSTSTHDLSDEFAKYTPYKGNLSTIISQGSPATEMKTYWESNTNVPINSVNTAYNTNGQECTFILSKGGSASYGSILKYGYGDLYMWILRRYNNAWRSTDWEKISAGYADSAGTATKANTIATEVGTSAGARPVFYSWLGDTTKVVYDNNFNYNPSGGVLTATKFVGALQGNADSATLLNQDTTYKEGTAYVCQTSAGTVKAFCSRANNSNIGLSTTGYGCMLLSATWGGGTSYNGELFMGMGDFPNLYFRGKNNGTYTAWKAIGQFTATPTSGQVVITDGTTGGMKSSGYTIAKSVPSNAVFTDQNVSQSATTTGNWRKIVLSYQDSASAGTAVTENTNVVYVTPNAEIQPSTGSIRTAGNLLVSGTVCANAANSSTAGGLSLYGTDPTAYGVIFRGTGNQGKHGYVTSDWATYFTMSNTNNRGWVFRRNGSGNVASIDTSGQMVLNGSLTIGGNETNTSGCRLVYSELGSVDFVFV